MLPVETRKRQGPPTSSGRTHFDTSLLKSDLHLLPDHRILLHQLFFYASNYARDISNFLKECKSRATRLAHHLKSGSLAFGVLADTVFATQTGFFLQLTRVLLPTLPVGWLNVVVKLSADPGHVSRSF